MTFKKLFSRVNIYQNPSGLSGFSAAGQAEGRQVARTFPGGCWVKKTATGREERQCLLMVKPLTRLSHSWDFTAYTGCRFLFFS